jgi:trimethylamine--corrinoid protein Co-methyltransferase
MQSAGLRGGQYRPLSPEQVQSLHTAALEILEEVGFTYEHGLDDTLEMLAAAGARLDRQAGRVYLPRQLVEEQAAKAPERVLLCGRRQGCDLDLSGDRVHLGTGGAALNVLDPQTGEARPSTLADLHRLGRLVDGLDNIHFFLRPCVARDLPGEIADVNVFYACLRATAKHVMAGVNDTDKLNEVIELASLVAGGEKALAERPIISIITSFAISPLKFCTASTLIMQECCRRGVPVALSAAPMAGSTSPMTMAGTLAQLHAEQLAGIAVCQLTSPGAPLLYGGIPGMANLRTMGYQGGSVECGMMNAAIHQLAAHIKVPNYNSSGLSDSKLPDAQAGWEKAFTTLLAAMGGSNYIHHAAGMLESMLTVAYEQYVMDDEIIGQACQVLKGMAIDPEHTAQDALAQVGPGGNFMMSPHTMAHMRSEFFQGNGVSDRWPRAKWSADGAKDARRRALEMALAILERPEEPQVSPEADRAIRQRFDIRL